MEPMLYLIVFQLGMAVATGVLANAKGYDVTTGAAVGLFFGLIGLLIYACLPNRGTPHEVFEKRMTATTERLLRDNPELRAAWEKNPELRAELWARVEGLEARLDSPDPQVRAALWAEIQDSPRRALGEREKRMRDDAQWRNTVFQAEEVTGAARWESALRSSPMILAARAKSVRENPEFRAVWEKWLLDNPEFGAAWERLQREETP
jgi:uncharacterized protein (DUF736 family)